MGKLAALLRKALRLLVHRLHTQGIGVTLIWLYARGLPALTGIPVMRYSQITPQLFVGPQFRQAGKRRLARLGITAVINMRAEFDDAAHGLTLERYCYLPTVDDQAPTLEHLAQGVDCIRRVTDGGGKVYIHCGGGIGRAPTMAVAYFVSQGYSVDAALALVRKARPFINVTPPQIEQLHRLADGKRAITSEEEYARKPVGDS